jgi:hypothetical protein
MLAPNQQCWKPVNALNRIPAGTTGSAFIDGGENLSVAVKEVQNNELNEHNGIVSAGGMQGWEQLGTILYAPQFKNNRYGRSSHIFVANAGSVATNVAVQFYDSSGGTVGNASLNNLPPQGSGVIGPTSCPSLCSAKISSSNDQPLAVVVREQTDGTTYDRTTYNAFSAGATSSFVPLLKKEVYGRTTGLAIQNLGAVQTHVSVTCYDINTGQAYSCGEQDVNSKATAVLVMNGPAGSNLPSGFRGSAVINSTGVAGNPAQPIAALISESGTPYKMMTNAPLSGSNVAHVPELYGNIVLNGQTWNSGISVQNISSTNNATVNVAYYNQNGVQVGQWSNQIGPRRVWILNYWAGNLPGNFQGSAVIQTSQTNQSIAAVVTVTHTGTGDTDGSYTASNR